MSDQRSSPTDLPDLERQVDRLWVSATLATALACAVAAAGVAAVVWTALAVAELRADVARLARGHEAVTRRIEALERRILSIP
jgi:vacuolar-type H+-ATPase subunit D/Vma8